MGLRELEKKDLKLIFFGGKGGVGKTTCALSSGFYLAKKGFKTLVISTDPAHSLSDGLGEEVGGKIKEIKSVKNLSALEINAEGAFSKFKVEYEEQIKKILDTSTYLDEEDINSLFALPIPGMDEVMGFKVIIDLIEEAKFDKYIVDTAPTGHALRLLTLPQLLDDWIKVMAKMRWKYRYMVETFAGKYDPDQEDDFLLSMKKTVKKIESLLKDKDECEFVVVAIPEEMAIQETERLINNLDKYGISVKQLVMNNVFQLGDCWFCREKRRGQEEYINRIKKQFGSLGMIVVPLQAREVKKINALNDFKDLLFK
jgi:arsenite-transporting ATPase